MPVIPQPVHDYSVLKVCLLFLVETTENLEIHNIFSPCNEDVYSKLIAPYNLESWR